MSRDKLYLQHILDAILKIERYTQVGRVWNVTQQDLPALCQAVEELLKE